MKVIDLQFQGQAGLIASFAIPCDGGWILVECGPASCRPSLLRGLAEIGASVEEVRALLVTHIHLDHSGDAGWWAQQGVPVYVHPAGLPHLVDPAKLIQSAQRIYGDKMQTLWGEILPAPAEQVKALHDEEVIRIGGVEIRAWDTAGHARHHLVFAIGDTCLVGDMAGMVLPGSRYLSVTSAPPQFELPEYLAGVERIRLGGFARLGLTHFGWVDQPELHLTQYASRLREVESRVRSGCEAGASSEELRAHYAEAEHRLALEAGLTQEQWTLLEMANSTTMCSAGIERWVRRS
jgi:glyoxylase-like metal-dependent hydrolase (beta-lactamase superfamily II)